MRAFVARLYDLTVLTVHQRYLPTPLPTMAISPASPNGPFYTARRTYWDENRHSFNAIARQSGFTAGALAMTAYYGVEGHPSISLNSAGYTTLIQAVSQWIDSQIP
jgi:hypothetical protein